MSLAVNNVLYEGGLDWVAATTRDQGPSLEAIRNVALLAWWHHPGRFVDGALENPALRWSEARAASTPPPGPILIGRPRAARTLHVASTLYETGGHTRTLLKWIRADTQSSPIVVLTDQAQPLPDAFEAQIERAGGVVIRLPVSEPLSRRVGLLRGYVREVDRVVLHTHPNDPVPIAALAEAGGPAVAIFAHAHFGLTLGSTISDLTISTTEYFRQVSVERRFARRTAILTGLPAVEPLGAESLDKPAAKTRIGLDPAAPVALTMARRGYLRPIAGYDFWATASRLLDEVPALHLLLVGADSDDDVVIPGALRRHARVHCTKPVADPLPYYRAADLCLESFPIPSLGAVAESVGCGEAFPVPVYGTECLLRSSLAPALSYPYRPSDEADYVRYVRGLLTNLSDTRAHAHEMRDALLRQDEEFPSQIAGLNANLDGLKHRPQVIPETSLSDAYDSRLLADLRPGDVDATLRRVFPFRRAARVYVAGVRKGLLRPSQAMRPMASWAWSAAAGRARRAWGRRSLPN